MIRNVRLFLHCIDKVYFANHFWNAHSLFCVFSSCAAPNGRFIVVVREAKDVFVSYFKYLPLVRPFSAAPSTASSSD